jgi:hypothetical protein
MQAGTGGQIPTKKGRALRRDPFRDALTARWIDQFALRLLIGLPISLP